MLSACSNKEECIPKVVPEYVELSPQLDENRTTCSEIPKPPFVTKQSEVASYIVNLTLVAKECRDNLIYVKEELDDE